MCGRIYIKASLRELLTNFSFARPGDVEPLSNSFPNYNGAPTQSYPIIVRDIVQEPDITGPIFVSARWGFVPEWSKDDGVARLAPINARAEGIQTHRMFRQAYKLKRCLVPINGFFEWKDIHGTGKNKQPYAIAMKDGSPYVLAGIWSRRRDPETGLDKQTFAIVTCEPNEMMVEIHDRMPVILHPEDYDRWLSPEPDPADLLKPFPSDLMTMWKIGRDVGNVRNNRPDIIDPMPDDPEPPLL